MLGELSSLPTQVLIYKILLVLRGLNYLSPLNNYYDVHLIYTMKIQSFKFS